MKLNFQISMENSGTQSTVKNVHGHWEKKKRPKIATTDYQKKRGKYQIFGR